MIGQRASLHTKTKKKNIESYIMYGADTSYTRIVITYGRWREEFFFQQPMAKTVVGYSQ